MAIKTWYLDSGLASGSNHHALSETLPVSTVNMSTGWLVSTVGAGNSSEMQANVIRSTSLITASAEVWNNPPNNSIGNCFRSPAPLNGLFQTGTWTLDFELILSSNPGNLPDGRIRMKIYKSSDPTGNTGMTLVSGTDAAPLALSNIVDISPTAKSSSLSLSLGSITMNNDYLFFMVMYESTSAGGSSSENVLIRKNSTGLKSVLKTTDFSATQTVSFPGLDTEHTNYPANTDFTIIPGPKTITFPDSNAIAPVTSVETTSAQVIPGPVTVSFNNPVDLNPEFGAAKVSYTARETIWNLGEYLI